MIECIVCMGGEWKMLNWMVSSTVLIVGILALRFFIKGKISLRIQYSLWAIVLIRLLLPISIGETVISVQNWLRHLPQNGVYEDYEVPQVKLPKVSNQQTYQDAKESYEGQGFDAVLKAEDAVVENVEYEIQETRKSEWSLTELVKLVWGIGSIVVGFWFMIANVRFWKKLLGTRKTLHIDEEMLASDTEKLLTECRKNLNIYVCDEVESPCLFGLIHPAIYVTSNIVKDEAVLRHVIAHEITHYLHRDHIWGYLRALCLVIHWYNPLVWYAAMLSRNDAELACDEASIVRLGETERVAYGHTLIELTCTRHTEVLLASTTMTGSKRTIKERIYMLSKKPKTKRYSAIVVVLAAILCVGCTFTGADTKNSEQGELQSPEDDLVDSDYLENNRINVVVTETEDARMETFFIELPAGLSEEEQEKLKAEMEHRKEEATQMIEIQREVAEKQVEFYQNIKNGIVVTDEEVTERILSLLNDEHKFEYKLSCEAAYDGTQEKLNVNGQTVFLVEEATSWEYYENIAKKYYSDEYIENQFTPFYFGTVFMEKDGKLYRAFSDGIGTTLIDSTMKVWHGKNGKYYVSINEESVGGGEYPTGYIMDLSENSIFGFKILDKVILFDDNSIE